MKPEVYVMDEARHFFALSFIMRIFGPYMGFTVPLWAGTSLSLCVSLSLSLSLSLSIHVSNAPASLAPLSLTIRPLSLSMHHNRHPALGRCSAGRAASV